MGKLEKNIYRLTFPIFIEVLFFTLMGTLDTLMLSRYSDTAVASVGVSNQILFLFGIIINVVAIGIGVVAAQYLGAKQIEKAKDTVVTGFYANLILGTVLTVLVLLLGNWFLQIIHTDPILMDNALIYIRIAGLSLVFTSLRIALSTGFRSFSKPKIVMVIMIIGNIINVGLNAVLIYGLFGFDELGVMGAALGTLYARIFMVIALVVMTYISLGIKLHKVRLHLSHLKKIVMIGFPAALENLMWNIAQIFIIAIINRVGVNAVIARTYIYTILSFIFIFSFSFASGNAIIVGYYIGEKTPDEAYKHTFKAFRISLVLVVTMTVLLNIFGDTILRIFTDDLEIIRMAKSVLLFAVLLEIGRSMNLVFIYALRSAGDTVFPVIMAVLSMFGIAVLFSYIFAISFEMGIVGIFLASMMDELVRGVTMVYRWMSRKWVTMQLVED